MHLLPMELRNPDDHLCQSDDQTLANHEKILQKGKLFECLINDD